MSAIKMRDPRRFTVFVRRGFAATCAHLGAARLRKPADERQMNANSRKLNAKSLNRP